MAKKIRRQFRTGSNTAAQQDNLRKTGNNRQIAYNRRNEPEHPEDLAEEQAAYKAQFSASYKRPPEVFYPEIEDESEKLLDIYKPLPYLDRCCTAPAAQ